MRRQHAYWVQAEQSGRHLPTDPEEHDGFRSTAPEPPVPALAGSDRDRGEFHDDRGPGRSDACAGAGVGDDAEEPGRDRRATPVWPGGPPVRCGRRPSARSVGTVPAPSRFRAATSASPIRPSRQPAVLPARAAVPAGQPARRRAARRGRSDARQETKARFAAKFILDALSPTNTLPGNPAALRKAFDTGGKSVVRGCATCSTTCATTAAGRRRSTAPASRSASTWPPRRARSSTAAT